ncbi:MAG: carbon-nitrogen hydrolase family protein, partial [Planctomycetes bacterium]|nr:carbon-nitrogen hydrolase family protein [Planctomycetota bacterium]
MSQGRIFSQKQQKQSIYTWIPSSSFDGLIAMDQNDKTNAAPFHCFSFRLSASRFLTGFCLVIVLLCFVDETICGESARTVRVAAISFVPKKLDLNGNAGQLEKSFREAATGKARIAVAPEGVLEGYIINQVLSEEIPVEKMREVAITIDDPLIRRFQNLAKELDMCLVFGFAERVESDVYNTAIFIDGQGTICGKYHKMQLAEGYHSDWWFNRLGEKSRAFETPYGRCGMLICNDRWNPNLAKIPALDGAQFLVIPSYGSTSKSQDDAVLSRGRENGLPVIEANV